MGLALGLLIAWVISPVKYVNTEPSSLSPVVKDQYRQVIALAYQSNHDLGRARQRIALVDPGSSFQSLAAQAQRMLAENTASQEARALAILAADMSKPVETGTLATANETAQPADPLTEQTQEQPTALAETPQAVAAVQSPTPPPVTLTPTITPTPAPTFTPRPTATPMRILDAPFTLINKQEMCGADSTPGLLQIEVTDSKGNPLPGVRIEITWEGGQDTLYTGLAPEIDAGYADFSMAEGIVYSVKIGEASKLVNGITISDCGGGWQLKFLEGG
jgi:hypothetical protein